LNNRRGCGYNSGMKLRYFCDGCGKEVPRNSQRCPHCGKFFASVQCPRCGHQGEARDFDAGCPSCGYLKLPGSSLSRFGRGRPLLSGTPGPGAGRGLYRLLGVVLTLALLGLMLLLYLRSR